MSADVDILLPLIPLHSVSVPSSPECEHTHTHHTHLPNHLLPTNVRTYAHMYAARSHEARPSTDLYINLTCMAPGDVNANITFEFLVRSSALNVTVSFTKRCSDVVDTPTSGQEDVPSGVRQILYIVTGLVAGVVVVIIVIVVIYHWRVLAGILRRRRTESDDE